MFGLSFEMSFLLVVCLLAACAFEFINGFHDTANAVATVIYTKSLKPNIAVIWSGIWNAVGVFVGGIAVAMGIIHLLPASALIDSNIYHSVAMILALIITAIIWNLGTWYFGLPCSSSHTLLGSIFGVGIAYMFLPEAGTVALNWMKVKDAGLSLLISPIIGFGLTLGLMVLLQKYAYKYTDLFEHQPKKKHPPLGIRALLILTCTSVSYTHGSNDGQKGVGLIMIILLAIVPAKFALNHSRSAEELVNSMYKIEHYVEKINKDSLTIEDKLNCQLIEEKISEVKEKLSGVKVFDSVSSKNAVVVRNNIAVIAKETNNVLSTNGNKPYLHLNDGEKKVLKQELSSIKGYVEFAPAWVIIMISLSLGLGTMIGWKRIVHTVGEKIGKTPLTYAQGVSAQLVTSVTISMSSALGLPVSTTHVLSSGVAGSMVAKEGLKNLRKKTVKNILTAWIITLPVTVVLAGSIFLLLRWIMG